MSLINCTRRFAHYLSPRYDGSVTRNIIYRVGYAAVVAVTSQHRVVINNARRIAQKSFTVKRLRETHASGKYVETVIIHSNFFLWRDFCRACELRFLTCCCLCNSLSMRLKFSDDQQYTYKKCV